MTPALTVAAFALAVLLIGTAIRTWQRERWLLYGLTPVVLIFALATGMAIDRLLGYPTADLADLKAEFAYVTHTGEDPIYLLAVPAGAAAPRLYAIPRDMLSEEERRGLAEAGVKAKAGAQQRGIFSEGEFELYDFDVRRLGPKEG